MLIKVIYLSAMSILRHSFEYHEVSSYCTDVVIKFLSHYYVIELHETMAN